MDIQTRETLANPMRYWEPRRILFNVFLAAVVVGWIVLTWPHFQEASVSEGVVFLLFAATVMNLCYSAVYLVEIPLRHSTLWRRWRWGLWLVGTLFALLLENYWIADEIYPYVR